MENIISKNHTRITLGLAITLMVSIVSGVLWIANELDKAERNEQQIQVHDEQISELNKEIGDNKQTIGEIKGDIRAIKSDTTWLRRRLSQTNN